MDVNKTKRVGQTSSYGIKPISKSAGSRTSFSFNDTFQKQLKGYYVNRAAALFDEITEQAESIIAHADIIAFERYRRLIGELIGEVVGNAYAVNSEYILDYSGKQRIYTTANIIDSKLERLASDILSQNSGRIDYLRRMDEIRGLVMDMFL